MALQLTPKPRASSFTLTNPRIIGETIRAGVELLRQLLYNHRVIVSSCQDNLNSTTGISGHGAGMSITDPPQSQGGSYTSHPAQCQLDSYAEQSGQFGMTFVGRVDPNTMPEAPKIGFPTSST